VLLKALTVLEGSLLDGAGLDFGGELAM